MKDVQAQINFDRISKAIAYIKDHFKDQPSLELVAQEIGLSPAHFQRLFTDWAGTSPKKFLQYISVEYAKRMLKEEQLSLFDTAYHTGLSSTSRLHDLFVTIEGMTPAEYKQGGKSLVIQYEFSASVFGKLLVASTTKGICYMAFEDERGAALENLKHRFPNATFQRHQDQFQRDALAVFQQDWNKLGKIMLHLKGTDFQLKVWENLLKIPMGNLTTYGRLAEEIGSPKAYRAVGTAIGNNPIAFLIPCHRVIQASGALGGYMWGCARKAAIIGWEGAIKHS